MTLCVASAEIKVPVLDLNMKRYPARTCLGGFWGVRERRLATRK